MNEIMHTLHFAAGFVVLAEALNKLERCHPLAPGLSAHARAVDALKALAWLLLALGAGGAVAVPVLLALGVQAQQAAGWLRLDAPTLDQTVILLGFAVLIIRTRVKEG